MCITEEKLVESYGKATPRERFRLIYAACTGIKTESAHAKAFIVIIPRLGIQSIMM